MRSMCRSLADRIRKAAQNSSLQVYSMIFRELRPDEYDLLNESDLYKELGVLTKDRSKWKENIPYISSLLNHESVKIKAKALWLLGEMGFTYPMKVQEVVPEIASFLDSPEPLLRERSINALG